MDNSAIVPVVFFGAVALCIITPIWLRTRLYAKTLDTVAKAIEKGIDPERIAIQLPSLQKDRDSDPNGNWKAGMVLLGLALAFALAISLPSWLFNHTDIVKMRTLVSIPPLMFGIMGLVLLQIHHKIVGRVVRLDERRETRSVELKNGEAQA